MTGFAGMCIGFPGLFAFHSIFLSFQSVCPHLPSVCLIQIPFLSLVSPSQVHLLPVAAAATAAASVDVCSDLIDGSSFSLTIFHLFLLLLSPPRVSVVHHCCSSRVRGIFGSSPVTDALGNMSDRVSEAVTDRSLGLYCVTCNRRLQRRARE